MAIFVHSPPYSRAHDRRLLWRTEKFVAPAGYRALDREAFSPVSQTGLTPWRLHVLLGVNINCRTRKPNLNIVEIRVYSCVHALIFMWKSCENSFIFTWKCVFVHVKIVWKFVYIHVNIAFLFMWKCVYIHVKMRFCSCENRVKMCLYSRENAFLFMWKSCENSFIFMWILRFLFMWKCVYIHGKMRLYSRENAFLFVWKFVYIHVNIAFLFMWKCVYIHGKMRLYSRANSHTMNNVTLSLQNNALKKQPHYQQCITSCCEPYSGDAGAVDSGGSQ